MRRLLTRLALSFAFASCLASGAPLVLNLQGDVWTWTPREGLERLTTWTYNERPVLSPDGTRVAYVSWARHTARFIAEQGGFGGGPAPSNIWVMNLRTRQAEPLTRQPERAEQAARRGDLLGVARSTPAWSPDGRFLAWTELEDNGAAEHLGVRAAIHDFAVKRAERVTLKVPAFCGVPFTPSLLWSKAGLALRWPLEAPKSGCDQREGTWVFAPSGRLLRRAAFTGTHLLEGPSGAWLASLTHANRLDLATGRQARAASAQEVIARGAPQGWRATFTGTWNAWTCSFSRGPARFSLKPCPLTAGDTLDFDFAMSPDGASVAYVANDGVYVRNANSIQKIWSGPSYGVRGLVWGHLDVRLRP